MIFLKGQIRAEARELSGEVKVRKRAILKTCIRSTICESGSKIRAKKGGFWSRERGKGRKKGHFFATFSSRAKSGKMVSRKAFLYTILFIIFFIYL